MASLKWLLLLLTYGTYPSGGLQEDGLDLTKVKVVVIGAGAAGLAATQRLLDGQFDVTLLEASDRIGGRIWTVSTDKGSKLYIFSTFICSQPTFDALLAFR
jgi:monoamine oxidase